MNYVACLIVMAGLLLPGSTVVAEVSATADTVPAYVSGHDVYVPQAPTGTPRRRWTPVAGPPHPGWARGGFDAALIAVWNEDTQFSKEVAVFRMENGAARAFLAESFSPADREAITQFKAKQPAPPPDRNLYRVKDFNHALDLLQKHEVNKFETQHFAFWYGNDRGREAQVLNDPNYLPRAGKWYEKIWTWNQVHMQAPMPYADQQVRYKINVSLTHSGLPWLTGDDWATSAEHMNLMPNAMFYGSTVVPHEFTHVIQFYSGGFRESDSVGAFWETHAEFGATMHSPFYDAQFQQMMGHLRYGFQYPKSRYANFPILIQLWEKRRTAPLVYGIWTANRRRSDGSTLEDPAETMVRIGATGGALPHGWVSFGDEVGEMAARLVAMDYINQRYFLDASRPFRRFPTLQSDKESWLRLGAADALFAYGVTHLPLRPADGAGRIKVELKGLTTANQASWRLTIVAVNDAGESRYSPMKRIVGKAEQTAEIDVRPGEHYTVAIAATPLQYVPLHWKEPVADPEQDYPFAIRVVGAATDAATTRSTP